MSATSLINIREEVIREIKRCVDELSDEVRHSYDKGVLNKANLIDKHELMKAMESEGWLSESVKRIIEEQRVFVATQIKGE